MVVLLKFAPRRDAVVGYRQPRREPFARRLNGWSWNPLIRCLFGYVARHVDSAFRLIRRLALASVVLTAEGGTISNGFLVDLNACRFALPELRVSYLPRQGGHPTGARLDIIARAAYGFVCYRDGD